MYGRQLSQPATTAPAFVDLQVADRLNAAGVPCNLVTGQEVRLLKGARHTACTVEMADLDRQVEVRAVHLA